MNRVLACAVCSVGALVVFAGAARGGSLTPPVGPVGATMKTLDQVEARIPIGPMTTPGDADSIYKITQPGSYYLMGDVLGVSGRSGIEIIASDVSIDLNGFTVRGVAGSVYGLRVDSTTAEHVEAHNGVVTGWGSDGVRFSVGSRHAVRQLRAHTNGVAGIRGGQFMRVSDCEASDNGGDGINVGSGSLVESCVASSNGGSGIFAGAASVIRSCVAYSNAGYGVVAGDSAVLQDCTLVGNQFDGASLGSASRVTNTTAHSNVQDGISVINGSSVEGCAVRFNNRYGILVGGDCLIVGNAVDGGTTGIRVESGDSRIVNNQVTDASIGIDVTGTGNILMGNTVAGSTTAYSVAAGNFCRVVAPTATAAAITGASGGTQLTTDPWANFAF